MRRYQGELPARVGFEPGWRPRKWFQLMDRGREKSPRKDTSRSEAQRRAGSDLGGWGQEQPRLKVLLSPRPGQWLGLPAPSPHRGGCGWGEGCWGVEGWAAALWEDRLSQRWVFAPPGVEARTGQVKFCDSMFIRKNLHD